MYRRDFFGLAKGLGAAWRAGVEYVAPRWLYPVMVKNAAGVASATYDSSWWSAKEQVGPHREFTLADLRRSIEAGRGTGAELPSIEWVSKGEFRRRGRFYKWLRDAAS